MKVTAFVFWRSFSEMWFHSMIYHLAYNWLEVVTHWYANVVGSTSSSCTVMAKHVICGSVLQSPPSPHITEHWVVC